MINTFSTVFTYNNKETAISRTKAIMNSKIMPYSGLITSKHDIFKSIVSEDDINRKFKLISKNIIDFPEYPENYLLLSEMYYTTFHDSSSAMKVYEKAVKNSVIDHRIYYNLAEEYTSRQKYHEALSLFYKTKQMDSNNYHVNKSIGFCFMKIGNLDSSIVFNKIFLSKVSEKDPNILLSLIYIGENYMNLNSYDSAIIYINKYLLTAPINDHSQAYANAILGNCYLCKNEQKTALMYFKQYLKIANPNDINYLKIKSTINKLSSN